MENPNASVYTVEFETPKKDGAKTLASTKTAIVEKEPMPPNDFDHARRRVFTNSSLLRLLIDDIEGNLKEDLGEVPAVLASLNNLRSIRDELLKDALEICAAVEDPSAWFARDDIWESEVGNVAEQAGRLYKDLKSKREAGSVVAQANSDDARSAGTSSSQPPSDLSLASSDLVSEVSVGDRSEGFSVEDDNNSTVSDSETYADNPPLPTTPVAPTPPPPQKPRFDAAPHNQSIRLNDTQTLNWLFLEDLSSPKTYNVEPDDVHFMLGKCDVFSVLANIQCNICLGKLRLVGFEHALKLLGQILRPRMNLLSIVNQAARIRANREFANGDVTGSLSSVLWAFEQADSEDEVSIDDPSARAAEQKAKALNVDWVDAVKYSKPAKTLFQKSMSVLVIVRAMSSFTLDYLMENMKNSAQLEKLLEKLESLLECGATGPLNLTSFFDKCLVPAANNPCGHVKKIGGDISTILVYELTNNSAVFPFVLKGESLPIEVLMEHCSEEAITQYVEANENPYLVGKNSHHQAITDNTFSQRRRCAVKSLFYSVWCPSITEVLCEHGLMSSEEAEGMSFGLACLAMSSYRDAKYNFITDDTHLHQGRKGVKEMKALREGAAIKRILKTAATASKAFSSDFMYADVTDDIKDETRHTLAIFTEYFEYDSITCEDIVHY